MSNIRKLLQLWKAALTFLIPQRWGVISEIYSITRFDAPISVSYSQGAEDLTLLHFLRKERGFYIDIGAHHPNRFSVTRLLYDQGWSGINVDANPDLKDEFLKFRPRDKFLNFAVGTNEAYSFTIFQEPAISTINNDWRDKFVEEGNLLLDEIEVQGITMKELFDMVPRDTELDLVNIDIEGGDIEALQSLGSKQDLPIKMPTWFLCESPAGVYEALESEAVQLILNFGYRPWAILPMSTLLRRR